MGRIPPRPRPFRCRPGLRPAASAGQGFAPRAACPRAPGPGPPRRSGDPRLPRRATFRRPAWPVRPRRVLAALLPRRTGALLRSILARALLCPRTAARGGIVVAFILAFRLPFRLLAA